MKLKTIIAVLLAAAVAAGLSACGAKSGDAVYAQSMRSLNDVGAVGVADRFAGVTVAGRTKEIRKDPSLTVEEIKVEEGQLVKAGDVLFTYNNESAALNVEQAKLEIESMKNKIDAANAQISELTKERNAAASSDKLGYTLEIQGLQADIRETQYNIALKEKELKTLTETAADTQVKSEIDGRVTSVNASGETAEDGSEKPFITIAEIGSLRVKGMINELNRGALNEGDTVTVRSRTDETKTWSGTIQTIDWENAEQGNRNEYDMGGGDEMTASSKYPFYITVENPDGLIVGQHVYIEPGETVSAWADELRIPAYFVNDAEENPWVWAVNGSDRLEKREVVLGDFDELMGEYVVVNGLTLDDYVAFPDETLKAGMKAEKTDGYVPMGEDGSMEEGGFSEDFGNEGDFDGAMNDEGFDGAAEDGEFAENGVYEGAYAGGGTLPEITGEGEEQA